MQRIKRLEASDSSQARGMDTQAMLPVLAMVAELIAMLGFRWVSVPDLRYSPYAQAGMLWKLEETAKGIAWNYQVPEAMTRAADQAAGYLRIGMAVSVILGLCFILQAFRVKLKAKRLGRLAFLWNTGMTAAVLWWATDTNMALNLLEGRANNFMNLTIYSHVQLTAAAYLQIVLALLIVPFLGKLLDTRKEYAAEYYQTRIETKDTGIGKRTILAFVLILTAIPAVIFFGIFFLNDRSDYFISMCIIILSMLPFFLVFENRRPQAREVVVIAVMAALAVAGRAAFFMLPQFKPTAAIVIIAGVGLGAEAGFLTGCAGRICLQLFLRAGTVDTLADVCFRDRGIPGRPDLSEKTGKMETFTSVALHLRGLSVLVIYGFLLDTASVFMGMGGINKAAFLAMYASGFPMNVIHGSATVIFLAVLGEPMLAKLERIRKKYGILEP